jgi:hypothetical protein
VGVGDDLPDGLVALRQEMPLGDIMRLIERTARWVSPETFRLLPVWYPEFARGVSVYKSNWTQPQLNKNRQTSDTVHKKEANIFANKALTRALGLRSDDRPNWSCCHIWGVDDALFQTANAIVQNPRYYSCVANMVLLPTPLKAFTDTMPDVKAMIRICARHLYGWHCDHPTVSESVAVIDGWTDWTVYPGSWPSPLKPNSQPMGVVQLNDRIRADIDHRLNKIRSDLASAGSNYPKAKVREVLDHWKIVL